MNTNMHKLVVLTLALAGCVVEDIEHDGESDEDFPQRMAQAYCAALFACDPATTCREYEAPLPYASEAECAAQEQELLEQVRESAHAAGLTYDAACVEATIASYAAKGCDNYERLLVVDSSALDVCPPYFGEIPEGENPCFEVVGSALSECGSGLVCEDEVCRVDNDDACACEAGLACNYEVHYSDVCVPILALGAECDYMEDSIAPPTGVCGADAYCDAQWNEDTMGWRGLCVPQKPLGSPCSYDVECSSYECLGTCEVATPAVCSSWMAPRRWR